MPSNTRDRENGTEKLSGNIHWQRPQLRIIEAKDKTKNSFGPSLDADSSSNGGS
jgi:hypothetical protein